MRSASRKLFFQVFVSSQLIQFTGSWVETIEAQICTLCENKKGNNKWKEKNQIGEKRGFCEPIAKYEDENQAKSSSVLEK